MFYLFTYLTLSILVSLMCGQWLARRQADDHALQLRLKLEDAIEREIDAYDENQRLLQSLRAAIDDRNAANLRAQRAINSLRALPVLTVRCPLPDKEAGIVPFNLN